MAFVDPETAAAQDTRTAPLGGRSAMVLIAGPDPVRRDAFAAVLREGGFEVASMSDETGPAPGSRSPAAIVIAHVPALAAGDLGLCRQLRASASTRDIPVVVLTSVDDEYTREQIVRAGATAILVEPLKHGLLVRRVRRLITHAGRRRRAS